MSSMWKVCLEDYLRDASSVPPVWQAYFRQHGELITVEVLHRRVIQRSDRPVCSTRRLLAYHRRLENSELILQHRVDRLVVAYRVHGHLAAKLDPLELAPRDHSPLAPESYGLTAADYDRTVISTFGGGCAANRDGARID